MSKNNRLPQTSDEINDQSQMDNIKMWSGLSVEESIRMTSGLHVDDHEQKQFPMMLMTHIGFAFPELFFSFPGIGMCKRYFWDSRA